MMLLQLCVLVGLCCRCLFADYTNSWAVELKGGPEVADRLAQKHDFINLGRVGSLENVYHFVHRRSPARSTRSLPAKHADLMAEPEVEFVQQQVALNRVKREVYAPPCNKMWSQQWYLQRPSRHDMNVEAVWKQGITGKGSVVSILDDGLEHKHPDLQANYDPLASYDFNDHDPDPQPRYDVSNENKHGTRCAGEVSSSSCGECGVGVAYNAKIGGVRMLDGDVTDVIEASSLSLNPQHVNIYSSSWGPNDDGETVDGPGRLAQKAFADGVSQGRGGLGSIFVWAAGNGGNHGDNCNCDGYAVSPYTISVSSVTERDSKPWYVEECSSILTSTYSSGSADEKMIMSADIRYISPGNAADVCTNQHTGTSASAPLAAGMLALALEANANLTWRDVQHIVILSSNPSFPTDPLWHKNGAGRMVSHKFGYGVLDGAVLVNRAKHWVTVPAQANCTVSATLSNSIADSDHSLTVTLSVPPVCPIVYLEHVQAITTISLLAGSRGHIAITLTSPHGTVSELLQERQSDYRTDGFHRWPFMTVHTWGEKPQGDWKFTLNVRSGSRASLDALDLVTFGTTQIPSAVANVPERCDPECKAGCARSGPQYCDECLHFRVASTLTCVSECPAGTFESQGMCWPCLPLCDRCSDQLTCIQCSAGSVKLLQGQCSESCSETTYRSPDGSCQPCHPSCFKCSGPLANQCTGCPSQYVINNGTCTMTCPPGYFLDGRTFACRVCHQTCAECSSRENTDCTACYVEYVLQGGKCVPNEDRSCGAGNYRNDATGKCVACPAGCTDCTDEVTCTSCQWDRFLETKRVNDSHVETQLCVEGCARGFFGDHATRACQPCSHYCDSCESYDNCTVCTLHPATPQDGRCPQPCAEGQFFDLVTQHCRPCDVAGCVQCYAGVCSKCGGALFLAPNGTCVSSCPVRTVTNSEAHSCEDASCHQTCLTCSGPNPNQCLSCPEGSTLFLSTCTRQCPPRTYSDGAACRHCDSSCDSCMGPSSDNCLSCARGYLLDHFRCVQHCPPGSFRAGLECLACPAHCETCTNAFECGVCEAGHLVMATDLTCVRSCPEVGYYEKDGRCVPCPQHCVRCSEFRCFSCEAHFSYYPANNKCVSHCPEGYYSDSGSCLECRSVCSTCKSPSECTLCAGPFRMDAATATCKPCCNPDNTGLGQCCDCDASDTECVWRKNPSVAGALAAPGQLTRTVGLAVVVSLIALLLLVAVLLVCYRCQRDLTSRSKQQYHAIPIKERKDTADTNVNDSGSEEEVYVHTAV